jgi:hypothetical protein
MVSIVCIGAAEGGVEVCPVGGGGHELSVAEADRPEAAGAPQQAEAFELEW